MSQVGANFRLRQTGKGQKTKTFVELLANSLQCVSYL